MMVMTAMIMMMMIMMMHDCGEDAVSTAKAYFCMVYCL